MPTYPQERLSYLFSYRFLLAWCKTVTDLLVVNYVIFIRNMVVHYLQTVIVDTPANKVEVKMV